MNMLQMRVNKLFDCIIHLHLQLTVRATDNQPTNPQQTTATVYVTVLRDLSPPRFTNLPFSIDLEENTNIDRYVSH